MISEFSMISRKINIQKHTRNQWMLCIKLSLNKLPSTVNGTDLGAHEWRDYLFLRYGIDPPDLIGHFGGCREALYKFHALDCKKGGLITARHNKLRDGVANLPRKAFTPTHVRDDPIIFTGRAVLGEKAKAKVKEALPKDKGGLKGGLLIIDLWTQGTDSIHDMRVVNTDAVYHQSKTPDK